jgi:hypothetical protein
VVWFLDFCCEGCGWGGGAIDVLDEDKTIIKGKTARESDRRWYLSELEVEHYELTRAEKDLLPVFAAPKTPYFFTEAAIHALEENNIRGVEFHPIPQQLAKIS